MQDKDTQDELGRTKLSPGAASYLDERMSAWRARMDEQVKEYTAADAKL